jgi:hypothetical protein
MAAAEEFAGMLRAQQEMQRGMLELIARMSQPPVANMVDNRGIGKPSSFRGEEVAITNGRRSWSPTSR